MKKLIVAFLLFFLSPTIIFATSGCCSGHGGVNCSAGAQSSGSVICNDGWTGSSCSYSSMVECGGSSTSSFTASNPSPSPVIIAPVPSPSPRPIVKPSPKPSPILLASPSPSLISTPTPTPTEVASPSPNPSSSSLPTTSQSKGDGSGRSFLLGLLIGGGGGFLLGKRKPKQPKIPE